MDVEMDGLAVFRRTKHDLDVMWYDMYVPRG